jgi:hypothetical protein
MQQSSESLLKLKLQALATFFSHKKTQQHHRNKKHHGK